MKLETKKKKIKLQYNSSQSVNELSLTACIETTATNNFYKMYEETTTTKDKGKIWHEGVHSFTISSTISMTDGILHDLPWIRHIVGSLWQGCQWKTATGGALAAVSHKSLATWSC